MNLNIDKTGWEKVKFGEVCRMINNTVKNIQSEGITHIVGLEHIEPNDLHIRSWNTPEKETTFTRKFCKGQVLFGRRRAYQRKVAYAEFDGICSGDILVFEAIETKLLPRLLPFIVQSEGFFTKAVDTSAGSLSPRTKFKDLAEYEFSLPPIEEQTRLAELLWAADEVVEREREVLSALEIYKNTLLKEKYQDFNKSLICYSDLVKINPTIKKYENQEQLGTFISMADVSNEGKIINSINKPIKELQGKGFTQFKEGDILFAKITPCMENGKGAIADDLTNNIGFGSTEFHVLRTKKKSDLLYCFYLSKMNIFRKKAERLMTGSAGQKRVQEDFFNYFKFHVPNEEDREVLGLKVKQIQEKMDKTNEILIQIIALKQRLINEIF